MASGRSHANFHRGMAIVAGAGLRQRLIDTRFYVAFRLATDGGQFRNNQVARSLEHSLLAERKRLEVAEIIEMLQHSSDLKNVAGAHLVGKILEAIFPIMSGRNKVRA